MKLRKESPIRLRDAGLDERWLQDRIAEDPTLLGLGELRLIQREKTQPSGGRIDFLMYDVESETRYEVEVMLGATDESHIIRAIEYWDIERQRYPTLDHRAVLIAEEITARFFNVIRLLNRAVPIIAIQLSAFKIDDSIVLHFTRVLDVYEFGGEAEAEEEGQTKTDREYWEKTADKRSLAVADKMIGLVSEISIPRATYNASHIAVGTTGYNFCWLRPRNTKSHCIVSLKGMGDDQRPIIEQLEEAGLPITIKKKGSVQIKLTNESLGSQVMNIKKLIDKSEQWSRR